MLVRAMTILAMALMLAACVPPRDAVSTTACSTNAQCPADGKHFCDTQTKMCALCKGTCPGFGGPSSDSGKNAVSETVTGAGAGSDTANQSSCKDRCDKYDVQATCQCDSACDGNGDCCYDYATLCAAGGDAAGADAEVVLLRMVNDD